MNIFRFIRPKSSVEYIYDTSTVRQALEKMRYHHYVAIPVISEDGVYLGTLRSEDIFKYFVEGKHSARSAEKDTVKEIFDKEYLKPLPHSASVDELFKMASEHNFAPVVDDRSCFIGLVLRRDVLDFLLKYYEKSEREE
ncbi:MAG: CBS domain-containing protein [Clostridia bacterium]|nr:CBS domain-containing protein [Clostridia bacterium]